MRKLKKYWPVMLMFCLLGILLANPSPYQSHNGYLGETVDTLTGALVLSSTDVSLPGRGGTGIQIVRSYNNKHYKTENSLHHLPADAGTDILVPKKLVRKSRTTTTGVGRSVRQSTKIYYEEEIDRDGSPWGWLKYHGHWTPETAAQFAGYAGKGWQFGAGGVLFLTEYSYWSDRKITKQDNVEVKDIAIQLGGGQSYYFDSRTLQPKDARIKARLTRVKDGYTLRDASGLTYHFTNRYFQKKMDTYEYRDKVRENGPSDEFVYAMNGDSQGYLLARVENPYGDWLEYEYQEKEIHNASSRAVENGRYLYYKEARPVKIHNSLGNEVNIGYNKDQQISELSCRAHDGSTLVWKYVYDKDKQLTQAINPRGEATEYTYKAGKDFYPGVIATVRSPQGAESGYTYYWQNLGDDNLNNYTVRTKKLTAGGKEYLWKYEHLNGHTYDIGNGKQFCFGETTITDPRNIKTTHYYKNGYPAREFLPDQVLTEYEWDYKTGNKIKEITVKGTKRYVTEYQDYDGHGNPGKIINHGDPDTGADDKEMVNEYLHNTGQAAGNGYEEITTETAEENFLVKQIVHSYVSRPGSGERHNEVYFRYDNKGNLIRKEVLVTDEKNNSQTIVTAYTYDTHGELEGKTLPNGLTARYRNDYNSNTEYTAREERPDGGWTQKTFNKRTGLLLREEDSYGNEIRYEHDRYGFQTKKIDRKRNLEEKDSYLLLPNSGAEYTHTDVYGHELRTILDQAGRKKRTEFRYKDGGQPKITRYEYHDKAPQLMARVTDYAGRTTETRYDSMDRPVIQRNFDGTHVETRYNDLLNYKEVYDVKSQKIMYYYDAYGNLIKTVQPNGAVTEYVYNIYGKLDKLITRTNSKNRDRDTVSVIEYKYDSINRLVEIRKGANITKMEYDNMDNIIRKTLPDNQAVEYVYDDLNRPQKTMHHDKARGTQTEEYKYYTDNDNLGRLKSVKDYTGITTYEYDKYGNIERVTREQYGQKRTTQYSYDQYGKLEWIQYPGMGDRVRYNYDNKQRLKDVEYIPPTGFAGAQSAANAADTASRAGNSALASLIKGGKQKLVEYEYTQDIHERLDRQIYGNGTVTRYGYDEHDRINHMEARSRDGQQIFKQEYKYDELGNRAELNWSIEGGNGQTSRYTYDTQYQLTRVDYDDLNRKPYIYRYDDNGNRTYFGHEHGEEYYAYEQYDRLTQRYIGEGRTLYRYDQRGNLIRKEKTINSQLQDTTDYDFDIQDRLRNIKHNGQLRAEYDYDSRGMRTKSIQHRIDKRPDPFALFGQQPSILKSEQYYWYGAGTEVLADTDEKGNVTGLYIMAGGNKIANIRFPLEKNKNTLKERINFYHTDVLGSITAITDGEGKVIEANIYGPFGETEFSYKATLHKVIPEKRAELLIDPFLYASDNRYTYTGQEQDEFGGLIYYNARWYDPEVGRFISEDPAAANPNDPLTINRYIYCRNNPLIYTDPTGEIFGIDDFVFIAICAVVGGIGHTIDAMTNPKNEWHGGNYNDAFWHGFGQGATAGSAIVGIANFCQGVASAIDKIFKIESNGFMDWAKQASDIFGAEKVSGTYLGKTYEDGIAKCGEDAVKYSSALISGKGGKGGTSQFFTKWAGSVNPFTNDYFKDFYNITVGNAYDIYTGQTRDIYKLYLVSATQIWGGKYIDAGIEKTKLVDMNSFSKGVFNYLTGNVINGNSINRHDAVNSGLEQADPLIISTSLFGNIHYSHYAKAVEDLSKL